ncbi:MAG: hypothetical protein K6F51_04840 [Acetatifactor sp.]|nr:hypothetical protein [Acetatifactor sp.]
MSKKRKVVMSILCLFSIYMINMPFMKHFDATALDLLNPQSQNGIQATELIGGDLAIVVKVIYVILVGLELVGIVLNWLKNGEWAKRWNYFAGIFETLSAVTLISNVYMFFMQYNELMGLDVFEHTIGKGLYFMLLLGILQILLAAGKNGEKDESIIDLVRGKNNDKGFE